MLQGRPDIVYHCAAWTAVDAAEDFRETVFRVNAQGTLNIAKACKETGCKMVYISTDYVFDGQGTEPWQPDCKDYAPLNVYGRSKLAGEEAVAGMLEKYFIIRIAWVFGVNGSKRYGYYDATNEGGYISWYDFACEIFRQAGYDTKVIPVTTQEYGLSKAVRPANSRLDKGKLSEMGFKRLPDWKDALHRYPEETGSVWDRSGLKNAE